MRQHVNPLSRVHQRPLPLPPPAELFGEPGRTIHLDIGSARGGFLLELAQQEPGRNYLGVEIRQPLVQAAEADRQALDLSNLHYLYCNANVSLEQWLAALHPGQLERVSIQFPDPWFKKKHHKRRVLQPALLLAIAGALTEQQELFIQSDVLEVIEPMVLLIEASGYFRRPPEDRRPWRLDNPLAVATERERLVLQQGLPVYRVLYARNNQPLETWPELPLEQRPKATDNPPERPELCP